jgi:hypothetical protein
MINVFNIKLLKSFLVVTGKIRFFWESGNYMYLFDSYRLHEEVKFFILFSK